MQNRTETLGIGSRAPDFSLTAANREGSFSLSRLRADGPAVLELHGVAFPFLLDEDRAVTKAYGLYHRFGKDAINIAHPATLIIDRNGTVRYIYRGDSQTDRAPIEQVTEAVRKLKASG